jgi:hypothetical protein
MAYYKSGKAELAGILMAIGLFFGAVALAISLIILKFWIVGSLLTSSIKVVSHDCGQTYSIEKVVSGNWFCSTEKR